MSSNNTKLKNESYYGMVGISDMLYEQSKNGENFNNLMKYITAEENIMLAYRNVKRNHGSITSGTDNVTIKDIEKLEKDEFVRIVREAFQEYKPKPVRRMEIPKANGKTRPLGIPCMIDRVVQQCILQVLEPICEAKFYNNSYGFRPLRSAEQAISATYRMIQLNKHYFVISFDISSFFDNVNHSRLKRQLWNFGIHDKALISIISKMLVAPVQDRNGKISIPECGTPQGGILSPILSNINLNELDWWVASQWEEMPTKHDYTMKRIDGDKVAIDRSNKYRALRDSKLKEMHIIRYADDFRIFCNNYEDAVKTYEAVKQWLWERLKLKVNEDKSGIIDVRKKTFEFLGIQIGTRLKGGKYVIKSNMTPKAKENAYQKLKQEIIEIQRCKDKEYAIEAINKYNLTVMGIHNYYRMATHINDDCNEISGRIVKIMRARLGRETLKRNGRLTGYIKETYGKSEMIRFRHGHVIVPIGYVQHKKPMDIKIGECLYTEDGRRISGNNDSYVYTLFQLMEAAERNFSIEYMDNRISLYSAQKGKCAITKVLLNYEDIHCHHKISQKQGGSDKYENLVIVHTDIHKLIHATVPETIQKYVQKWNLTNDQINKINKLRKLLELEKIEVPK